MGEVRVRVKLVNAVDEGLVQRGLLSAAEVRVYETDALIDTGAVVSTMPRRVFQNLGLAVARRERAEFANEAVEEVDVTQVVGVELEGRSTTEEMFVLGNEVLIGRIALARLDLLVDCHNGRLLPRHAQGLILKIK